MFSVFCLHRRFTSSDFVFVMFFTNVSQSTVLPCSILYSRGREVCLMANVIPSLEAEGQACINVSMAGYCVLT